MKVNSIEPMHVINSPIMFYTFKVTFCFHIEFHRKTTLINCCELKKIENIKKAIIVTYAL